MRIAISLFLIVSMGVRRWDKEQREKRGRLYSLFFCYHSHAFLSLSLLRLIQGGGAQFLAPSPLCQRSRNRERGALSFLFFSRNDNGKSSLSLVFYEEETGSYSFCNDGDLFERFSANEETISMLYPNLARAIPIVHTYPVVFPTAAGYEANEKPPLIQTAEMRLRGRVKGGDGDRVIERDNGKWREH